MPYEILALGSNGSGQLGIGNLQDVSSPTPCKFLDPETGQITSKLLVKPIALSAGGNHALIILEDETLYATGLNENGRCGLDDSTNASAHSAVFRKVEFLNGDVEVTRFQLCSATWEASTFLTKENVVYSSGTGLRGELGLGEGITCSTKPSRVPPFCPPDEHIVQLAACMNHSVAVLSNGDIYGWGNGRKGQLGEPQETVWSPRKIQGIPFKASRAACGRDFTYIAGAPESGKHIILGPDKWNIKSSAPTNVKNWRQISATWCGVHVDMDTGSGNEIVSWGRNDHGQHASQDLPKIATPSDTRPSIFAGSEHVIAQTDHGMSIAWGWGEHGNCGSPVDKRGDVLSEYNAIFHGEDTNVLGAGCATSYLVIEVK